MNEKTFGIIIGIILTIAVALISISLFIFFIYKFQPGFICDLCKCSIEDIFQGVTTPFGLK